LCDGKKITISESFTQSTLCFDKKHILLASDKEIALYDLAGNQLEKMEYTLPQGSSLYLLIPTPYSLYGARMVIAYEENYQSELFWQHDIDFKNKKISEPISKWR
jgi:hypothetical protein